MYYMLMLFQMIIRSSAAEDNKTEEANPDTKLTNEAFSPLNMIPPSIEPFMKIVVESVDYIDAETRELLAQKLKTLQASINKVTEDVMAKINAILETNKTALKDNISSEHKSLVEGLSNDVRGTDKQKSLDQLVQKNNTAATIAFDQLYEKKSKLYGGLLADKNNSVQTTLWNILDDIDKPDDMVLSFIPVDESDVRQIAHDTSSFMKDMSTITEIFVNEWLRERTDVKNKKNVDELMKNLNSQRLAFLESSNGKLKEANDTENRDVTEIVKDGNLEIRKLYMEEIEKFSNDIIRIVQNVTSTGMEKYKELLNTVNIDLIRKFVPTFFKDKKDDN